MNKSVCTCEPESWERNVHWFEATAWGRGACVTPAAKETTITAKTSAQLAKDKQIFKF